MRGTLLLCALLACSRRAPPPRADEITASKKADAASKPPASGEASVTVTPPSSATAVASEPKVPLTPFLSMAPNTIPSGAYHRPPAPHATTYAPKGFNPLTASGGQTFHLPGGLDVHAFTLNDGMSDYKHYVATATGGKLVNTFDYVVTYAVDVRGGHLALHHARVDGSGKKVFASEILDLASGSWSPLPDMPCTGEYHFVDGGLLTHGWVDDKPATPHAWICLFDTVGKLMVQIDAGLHNHHAASSDYINMRSGVLSKEPHVVWATREYQSYGNYDITLLDTHAPHARKMARLSTPSQPGSLANLELDLAETTMVSSEVRYRAKSLEGWYWKWQTAKLFEAP